jgi:hypothetical protein
MDELTLLRELDADTPPPAPRAMYDARMRLRYELAYERDRRRRSQAPRVLVTAVAMAAAIAAGAIVLGGGSDAVAPAPKVQLTAAGEWLQAAARDAAAEAGVPGAIPRDDQYLYRKEIIEDRPLDGEGAPMRFVDEFWLPVGGEGLWRTSERGRSWDGPAGWLRVRYEDLRRLPTAPGQLLLYLRSWPEDGRTIQAPMTDSEYFTAYLVCLGLLRDADLPMPAGLRAAIFDALARIPGVEMTKDEVDARGRRGVGIKGPVLSQTTIIDPRTYEYLGFRSTLVRDEDGERVEQRSSVVDRAVVDRLGQRP